MEGNSQFAYKMLIFSIVILSAMPIMLNAFIPHEDRIAEYDAVMEDYYSFTGTTQGKMSETVWALEGIYTPYGTDADGNPNMGYGYSEDGWIYGSRVAYNHPTQFQGTSQDFDVVRDDKSGLYRYASDSEDYVEPTTQTDRNGQTIQIGVDAEGHPVNTLVTNGQGHAKGDLYTSVVFDSAKKSNIFFSEAMKYTQDGQRYPSGSKEPFYYEYTGYRYAFVPISSSTTLDGDGNEITVSRSSTSLSLIWYSYYRSDGISGQLVISGTDFSTAYLTSDNIIRAFDSTTSVAKFPMTFNNGVQMNVYVKISAPMLASGLTVEECYNIGYWSVMITSLSTDTADYAGPQFELNPERIFTTIVKLMTFDYTDFGMSPMMGFICSLTIVVPLYAGLIALALNMAWPAMAAVGIFGAVEAIASLIPKLGWF